ncbi:MAG: DUF2141 domain-containing protein [Bacteroidota bacterium]
MRNLLTLTLLLIGSILMAQSYTVEVNVRNVRSGDGVISAGLYNSADEFPEKGKEFMGVKTDAKEGITTIRFEDVPAGKYAIAILHDENKNDEMDRNFLGFTQEGYCFSNKARSKLGAPKFEKAAFRVQGDVYTTVFMNY